MAAEGLEVSSCGEGKVIHPAEFLFTVLSLFLGVRSFRVCTAYCCCFSQSGFQGHCLEEAGVVPVSYLISGAKMEGKHSAFLFSKASSCFKLIKIGRKTSVNLLGYFKK